MEFDKAADVSGAKVRHHSCFDMKQISAQRGLILILIRFTKSRHHRSFCWHCCRHQTKIRGAWMICNRSNANACSCAFTCLFSFGRQWKWERERARITSNSLQTTVEHVSGSIQIASNPSDKVSLKTGSRRVLILVKVISLDPVISRENEGP